MFFSTLEDIIEAWDKTNHWTSLHLMIICQKDISEECSWFNVNVNASQKFFWAFGELLEGTQALGHLKGTDTLGHS